MAQDFHEGNAFKMLKFGEKSNSQSNLQMNENFEGSAFSIYLFIYLSIK